MAVALLLLLSVSAPDTSGAAAASPAVAPAQAGSTPAAPFVGSSAGCTLDDPTTKGCLTPVAAHGLAEIGRAFGGYQHGPVILAASCWDKHAWNPTSDHPKGRACDLFPCHPGVFPAGAQLDNGWKVARWLRANAGPLDVRYVIFQGRIWQADVNRDVGGWGKRYSGGGIYDARDATGGHYDHVHVSFAA